MNFSLDNESRNNHSSSHSKQAADFRIVGIVIGFTAIILGMIGNLLTIIVFKRSSRLQLSFNWFVISLAAVDFLTAILMLPFNVAGYIKMDWPLGGPDNFTSSIQAFVYFSCGYTSITCLVAITVNRYISIQHSKHYSSLFTPLRVKIAIVISWLVAPAFLFPVLVGRTDKGKKIMGWDPKLFLCTFINMDDAWGTYMQVLRVVFQFLPIVLMVCTYVAMFVSVRASHKQRKNDDLPWELDNTSSQAQAYSSTKDPDCTITLNEEEAKIAQEMKIHEKNTLEKRLLRISAMICFVFMLLFMPSLVTNLLPNRRELDVRIQMLASNITWLNCCVNPFIYASLNPKFRVEYMILIKYVRLKLCGQI